MRSTLTLGCCPIASYVVDLAAITAQGMRSTAIEQVMATLYRMFRALRFLCRSVMRPGPRPVDVSTVFASSPVFHLYAVRGAVFAAKYCTATWLVKVPLNLFLEQGSSALAMRSSAARHMSAGACTFGSYIPVPRSGKKCNGITAYCFTLFGGANRFGGGSGDALGPGSSVSTWLKPRR